MATNINIPTKITRNKTNVDKDAFVQKC